jgi:hypothetical protein
MDAVCPAPPFLPTAEITSGKIIHGDLHATLKVKTSALASELQKRLENIAALLASPELKIEDSPVLLNVERLSDRDFCYLIGLRIGNGAIQQEGFHLASSLQPLRVSVFAFHLAETTSQFVET